MTFLKLNFAWNFLFNAVNILRTFGVWKLLMPEGGRTTVGSGRHYILVSSSDAQAMKAIFKCSMQSNTALSSPWRLIAALNANHAMMHTYTTLQSF